MSSSGCILKCRLAGVIFRCHLAVYFDVSCSKGYFKVSCSGCILKCRVAGFIFRCRLVGVF